MLTDLKRFKTHSSLVFFFLNKVSFWLSPCLFHSQFPESPQTPVGIYKGSRISSGSELQQPSN